MNTHCIYCTFDLVNEKYYIGYQSQSDRIKNGEYYGSPMNKNAQEAWADKDNLFVSILGYFETESEGYVAETELQTFMDAAADSQSWNGSNDSFRKGEQNKNKLGFIQRVLSFTWWGDNEKKKERKTSVLSESDKTSMASYIKSFDYYDPAEYSDIKLIKEDEEILIETPTEMETQNLNAFLIQARKDCYDRGFKCGNAPLEAKYKRELENLRIELDGQLEARLFSLGEQKVAIESQIENLPKGSKRFTDSTMLKAKIEYQIAYILEQLQGDKFYNIIATSFEKGYIDRIDADQ